MKLASGSAPGGKMSAAKDGRVLTVILTVRANFETKHSLLWPSATLDKALLIITEMTYC